MVAPSSVGSRLVRSVRAAAARASDAGFRFAAGTAQMSGDLLMQINGGNSVAAALAAVLGGWIVERFRLLAARLNRHVKVNVKTSAGVMQ